MYLYFADEGAVKGNGGLNNNDARNRNLYRVCDLLVKVHHRSRYIMLILLFLACCVKPTSFFFLHP